jgi:hypothetical protein
MRNIHFVAAGVLCMATFFLFMGMGGCRQPESFEQERLYGRWEISKAERNGKETSYLRNGYFVFQHDGMMTVNITGEDEKGRFVMDNNRVIMNDEKIFEIQSLHQDSLTIHYNTDQNSTFIFYMLRKKEDVQ